MTSEERDQFWPSLAFSDWAETAATLHLWTQIVGKIRLTLMPWINHSWHVTLYLTSRGLTTSPIPHGLRTFEIRFDFIAHELRIVSSDGACRVLKLKAMPVAQFYGELMEALAQMDLPVRIHLLPNELENPIPFDQDETHRSYDADAANRFWRVLVQCERLFTKFRARFCGKCSPVHFFWGSFDLAVTRFSGRSAPPHPGGVPHLPLAVAREAYSQEVSSLGFWPGNAAMPTPLFYSYAYPEPAGFDRAAIAPSSASYLAALHEFILPYEAVRTAEAPDDLVLEFAQSAYDAASLLGGWDRDALREQKPSLHSAPSHP